MKKDLQSYEQHDGEYSSEEDIIRKAKEIVDDYAKKNIFKTLGFQLALTLTKELPKTHIDIGSGIGWLPHTTAKLFDHVVGIEPSQAAYTTAQEINKHYTNVRFLNKDMLDGLEELSVKEAVFLTTATVLNHIEDYYVKEFLAKVNMLPHGSVLFFDERYDKNLQWKLWHVRSKEWWIKNLPNWQLIFLNIDIGNYSSGIYGMCVGGEQVLKSPKKDLFSEIYWVLGRGYYVIERVIKKLYSLLIR